MTSYAVLRLGEAEQLRQEKYIQNVTVHLRDIADQKGRPVRAFIQTFGCQQNVNDSEILAGYLAKCGFELVKTIEEADFVLFNTCSVRENADLVFRASYR